jgi:hypothetical protein
MPLRAPSGYPQSARLPFERSQPFLRLLDLAPVVINDLAVSIHLFPEIPDPCEEPFAKRRCSPFVVVRHRGNLRHNPSRPMLDEKSSAIIKSVIDDWRPGDVQYADKAPLEPKPSLTPAR